MAAIRGEVLGRGERAAQREEAALGGHRDPAEFVWGSFGDFGALGLFMGFWGSLGVQGFLGLGDSWGLGILGLGILEFWRFKGLLL